MAKKPFKDILPLDGKVRVRQPGGFVEFGIYRGYLGTDKRMCAVQFEGHRGSVWIDRKNLEAAE